MAAGSGIGDIYLREVGSDRFAAHLVGHAGRILLLGFTDDPDLLVSGAADGTIRIWSLSEVRPIAQVRTDASLFCGAFDPHAGRLLTGGPTGVLAMALDRGEASG